MKRLIVMLLSKIFNQSINAYCDNCKLSIGQFHTVKECEQALEAHVKLVGCEDND